MGLIATPSPTPSASEAVCALPSFIDKTANPSSAHNMDRLDDSTWSYGTPPFDGPSMHLEPAHASQYQEPPPYKTPHVNFSELEVNNESMGLEYWANGHSSPQTGGINENRQGDSESSAQPAPLQQKKSRRKSAKTDKKLQYPDLVEPLSQWAKDNNVQPKDVHGFATRDIKKRIMQATKQGYIKRNLNVFFLYKRAYANVAQAWMEIHHPERAKTQPPIVSLVGESWSKESGQFKSSYMMYSELEKEGLRKAFPDYRYKPRMKKPSPATGEPHDTDETGPEDRSVTASPHARAQSIPQDHYTSYSGPEDGLMHYGPQGLLAPPVTQRHFSPDTVPGYGSYLIQSHHGDMMGSFDERIQRSVSPALTHRSQQATDIIPVDPSLAGGYSDFLPPRITSGEPGYVVPSQTYANSSDMNYSRMSSVEPRFGVVNSDTVDLASGAWQSRMLESRGMSEPPPWHEAADSVLSSVPMGDTLSQPAHGIEDPVWCLNMLEPADQLPPLAWDINDWTHGLE